MTDAIQGLKIGVGTKIDDVYSDKEAFEQAKQADKNGDHVIDQDELNRYVGPVFVENLATKEGRLEGFAIHGRLSEGTLKDSELDYYPGLTLDKVRTGRDLKTFANIDIDGDKKLSAEEILLFSKKNKLEKMKAENNKIEEAKSFSYKFYNTLGTFFGASAGLFIGGFTVGIESLGVALGIMAVGTGIGVLLGLGVGMLLGAIDTHYLKKNTENNNKKIKELETQVKKGTEEILGKAKEGK